jgi:GxxExxY protein
MDYRKYKEMVYEVIGAAMEVHNELNWGLLEPVYNEALHLELLDRGIQNESEQLLNCYYKHHTMEKFYKMDIVVGDIVVELKSVDELCGAHRAQLFNYLRLTKKPVGLLINFGCESLQGERYGYDKETNECILLDKNMLPVY